MKKKVIAMIPARYGSKRVKKKNLRLIDGKPLISYVIEVVKKTNIFDEIYVNSEHEIFGKLAEEYGVKFYNRPEEFSTDKSTNDEFGLDFINNVEGDVLIQILPTSPLITAEEIENFTRHMLDKNLDTLISVEESQIACLYKGEPLNFSRLKINPPSQEMTPVLAYATVLMGWTYESFRANMEKFGAAYHGGDTLTEYFPVRGLATVDIDREEDFVLAESLILARKNADSNEVKYYDE